MAVSIDSTGNFNWNYKSMDVLQKITKIERNFGDCIKYIDVDTNEEVDPKNPFEREILKRN
ncbi:hypothetical protein [Polystyrenella longa]|nr:hypothetical protein [Polystyrenella longa]